MFKKNKNLLLFLILIGALGITYWFEERGNLQTGKIEAKKVEILSTENLGELKAVKGIKIDLVKEGDDYYARDNHLLLSRPRMDEFFKILGGVKVKTFLTEADVAKVGRAFYIPDDALTLTFTFEKGSLSFTLGKKLSFDQTFYMEVFKDGKKQIVIANDESPDPAIYQNEKDYQRSEAKYKRLQIIFMLTNVYFYDTRLFKDFYAKEESLHFDSMTILTFRNKKYTLDFKSTTTNPPSPIGLGYFEENWISFIRTLTKLEAKTVIAPYEPSALSEVLSQFEIVDRAQRKITLTVYKKFGELNGYFLTSSLDKVLYVLKQEDARYFFVNVQDFWKKKIAPIGKEYQLDISFLDGASEQVKISDQELFKVTTTKPGLAVRPLEFKKLMDFLKTEGDHISEMTEKPSEILKKNIMRLHFENSSLSVILEDNDAVLVDVERKIKIHHYVGAKLPFSLKRTDYFEKVL
jgi:hypothetical protein